MSRVASVVLLSGGLDSSANLAMGVERDEVKLAIHVNYGQRAELAEKRACEKLCAYYGVPLQVIDAVWLGAMGGSSLTDSRLPIPDLKHADLDDFTKAEKTAKSVWVPNRNGVLIQIAASFAERSGAKRVLVGFNREEATTFPDNSEDFLNRSTHALQLSTQNQVDVFCYTTRSDKTEIVAELKKLKKSFPFDLVWSCYHSGEKPCGKCESCSRHNRALEIVS
jgi:7-cyano-7-deazaguanine synthase